MARSKDDSVYRFWDNCHHKGDEKWLTGSDLSSVSSYFGINKLLSKPKKILNIGVGLGKCTHSLFQQGHLVSAADISPTALKHVKPYCEAVYEPSEYQQIPDNYYDLAICFLVAQHMKNQDLAHQFKHVIRAIKPNGLFVIQIAFSPFKKSLDDTKITNEDVKYGGVCRPHWFINKMIHQSNGKIVNLTEMKYFPQYGSGWYGLHIAKQSSKRKEISIFEKIKVDLKIIKYGILMTLKKKA